MFDVMDLSAEIEKAKTTLNAADNLFQRHQLRFDNDDEEAYANMTLAQRLDRTRKIASMEIPVEKKPKKSLYKLVPVKEDEIPIVPEHKRRERIHSIVNENAFSENTQESRGNSKSYSKRKKSVSF